MNTSQYELLFLFDLLKFVETPENLIHIWLVDKLITVRVVNNVCVSNQESSVPST